MLCEKKTLRFANIIFPKELEEIHISNCDLAVFNNPELNKLQLKELSLNSVNQVMVGPKIFKRVDTFVMENVKELGLEESALEHLESNRVHFINTNFKEIRNKEIKPKRIQLELLFSRSTLPRNVVLNLEEPQLSLPSLIFNDCQIEGIKMDVNVADLQMINNRFHQLPTKKSLDIHYSKFVSLTRNTLIGSTHPTLPDVNEKKINGEIKKSEIPYEDSESHTADTFLDAFNFQFKPSLELLTTSTTAPSSATVDTRGRSNRSPSSIPPKTNDATYPLVNFGLLTMTIISMSL